MCVERSMLTTGVQEGVWSCAFTHGRGDPACAWRFFCLYVSARLSTYLLLCLPGNLLSPMFSTVLGRTVRSGKIIRHARVRRRRAHGLARACREPGSRPEMV